VQTRFGFKAHQTPETVCKTCGAAMKPETAKNGGWVVNCAMCRSLNRRAEHRTLRRLAEKQKKYHEDLGIQDWAKRYPYMARFIGHDCDKAGCR